MQIVLTMILSAEVTGIWHEAWPWDDNFGGFLPIAERTLWPVVVFNSPRKEPMREEKSVQLRAEVGEAIHKKTIQAHAHMCTAAWAVKFPFSRERR